MDKATIRRQQKHIRKTALAQADTGDTAGAVFYVPLYDNIHRLLARFPSSHTVAGYYPIADEIDILPVLNSMPNPAALPCALQKDSPLIFRLWRATDVLDTDIYNIPCPVPTAQTTVPDIILVPLLAFDSRGYRLGYGGGFYDRTIAAYAPPVTIGIGIDALQMPTVPIEATDQPLTHIVTETRILHIT